MSELQNQTIADFGEQWTEYPDSHGVFGSADLFNDFCHPFVDIRLHHRYGRSWTVTGIKP